MRTAVPHRNQSSSVWRSSSSLTCFTFLKVQKLAELDIKFEHYSHAWRSVGTPDWSVWLLVEFPDAALWVVSKREAVQSSSSEAKGKTPTDFTEHDLCLGERVTDYPPTINSSLSDTKNFGGFRSNEGTPHRKISKSERSVNLYSMAVFSSILWNLLRSCKTGHE